MQAGSPYLEDLVASADIYQDVLVYTYFRTRDAPAETVLARLAGGDPLILHKAFGRGHVILVTTAATTDWTTLPVRHLFLPLLVRIVHLAARTDETRHNLLAGQPFEANLWPRVRTQVPVEVTGPLGPRGETASEQVTTTLDPAAGLNRFTFAKTWHPGYYTYRVPGAGTLQRIFATNPDGRESDLTELDADRLREAFAPAECHVAPSLEALLARFKETARRELWQYFLMLCLVMAVAEPLLANWLRPEHRRRRAHPTVIQEPPARARG